MNRILFFALSCGLFCSRAAVSDESPHWAFQAVKASSVPEVGDAKSLRSPIDAFIFRRLKSEGITPSPAADPLTQMRRVTLDLIGLPPHPQEVQAFLNDAELDRYERLVDRLLASPRYGEKWATPWLDLCHYADTDGYLTDQLRPVAWRYRDWLVDAINRNMPFDEFTVAQIAGDLLPDATLDQKLATGFLRQTLSNREGGAEPEEFRVKQIVDRTEMVGTVWLGLTVGCARCHDHKYDPISQQEFFQLYGCLNNADEVNIDAPLPQERDAFESSRGDYEKARAKLLAPLHEELNVLQRRWEDKCLHARDNPGTDHIWDRQWELLGLVWGGGLGEGQLEGQEIARLPWNRRTARQRSDLLDYFLRSGSEIDSQKFKDLKLSDLRSELDALKDRFPKATRAPVMQASLNRRQGFIHERGDFRDRGKDVQPGTPKCLAEWENNIDEPPRLRLARWLVSKKNPLTARVTVNRAWEQFFGRGLVYTTEDFGVRGTPPSHPDLLNWLAAEFMNSGWDMKQLHRTIVCSAAYRRSSEYRSDLTTRDPENVLLARQNPLRLSAEVVRDSGLCASGLLSLKIGGPSVRPPQPSRVTEEGFGNHKWERSAAPDCYRRSLYTFRIRTTPFAQGITFDAPNPNDICTRRPRSNTPLQALTLLNDPMFFEMAQALADRLLLAEEATDEERITAAFQLCVTRMPTNSEREELISFLQLQREQQTNKDIASVKLDYDFKSASDVAQQRVWTNIASVMLNLHEFITRP